MTQNRDVTLDMSPNRDVTLSDSPSQSGTENPKPGAGVAPLRARGVCRNKRSAACPANHFLVPCFFLFFSVRLETIFQGGARCRRCARGGRAMSRQRTKRMLRGPVFQVGRSKNRRQDGSARI